VKGPAVRLLETRTAEVADARKKISFLYFGDAMQLMDYFENQYLRSRFLRPHTIASYRRACKNFATIPMDAIPALLHEFATRELARGVSPYTVRGQLVIFCCLLSHASRQGVIDGFRRPTMPRCPRKIVRATPAEDLLRLIQHCLTLRGRLKQSGIRRSVYWPAFVAVSYETALRTSDLLQLRWKDNGIWQISQVKTGRPVSVSVGDRTLELAKKLSESSPTLFDQGWRREWYCRGLQRIARQIGIDICPQQIRQSAASEAERLKPGSAWVILGHGSPATTQRWYIDESHAYADLPRPRIRWN
jgi:integrase